METTITQIIPPAGTQLQPLVLKLDEGLTPDTAQSLRAAAAAPDREKLDAIAQAIRTLPVPKMSTHAGKEIETLIRSQVEKFATWIENQKTKLN